MSAVLALRPDAVVPSALRPLPSPSLTPQQFVERRVDEYLRRPERLMRNTLAAAHGRQQSRRFTGESISGFGGF